MFITWEQVNQCLLIETVQLHHNMHDAILTEASQHTSYVDRNSATNTSFRQCYVKLQGLNTCA